MKNIAKNIRKIRELKNYKQEYIANELNISVRGYSKIENEETQITVNRLVEIANILEVDPMEIIQFDSNKVINNNQDFDLQFLIDSVENINKQNKIILEYISKKTLSNG